MKIDILTLFPDMFKNVLGESIVKIAQKKKKVSIKVHNLRKWTVDRRKTADDRPYGGGSGMVMKIEPIYKGLAEIVGKNRIKKLLDRKESPANMRIILMTPRGRCFNQKLAKNLSKTKHLVLICGHYEGIDERVRFFITDELSVGDYVLTGGEIPAMAVVDAIARLIPGVLGDEASLEQESFEGGLLEYPHYTRPQVFKKLKVPEVLLSGNHKSIESWRKKEAIKKTKEIRKGL